MEELFIKPSRNRLCVQKSTHCKLFPFVNFMSKISDIMHVYLKDFELPELNNSKYYRKFPFLLNPNYQRAEIMRFFFGTIYKMVMFLEHYKILNSSEQSQKN